MGCYVEKINELVGEQPGEIVSPGQAVKAMIINGLGLVSAPLYLFSKFFEGKATRHLIGEGIEPEHLNDDRLGRVLDKLYLVGVSQIFANIALAAASKFEVGLQTTHLDSSSFHLHGEYEFDCPTVCLTSEEILTGESNNSSINNQIAPTPIKVRKNPESDAANNTNNDEGDSIFKVKAQLELDQSVVTKETKASGRFILATNVMDAEQLAPDEMIIKYKEQQATERGFGFLKDPLFFTDSLFLKSPERIEALALVMGLCLLVYTLGQRFLRQSLQFTNSTVKNQLVQEAEGRRQEAGGNPPLLIVGLKQ